MTTNKRKGKQKGIYTQSIVISLSLCSVFEKKMMSQHVIIVSNPSSMSVSMQNENCNCTYKKAQITNLQNNTHRKQVFPPLYPGKAQKYLSVTIQDHNQTVHHRRPQLEFLTKIQVLHFHYEGNTILLLLQIDLLLHTLNDN